MSLLDDNYRIRTGDPDRDAQISRGLLMAGLQLMGSRGRLLPALGQAGMAGVQASDQTAQMQQARQMQQMQQQMGKYALAEKKREADLAALPGQFYRPPSAPAIDATGGMDTAVEAPNNASGPGRFDTEGYIGAVRNMLGPVKAREIEMALAKPQAPLVPVAEGASLFDPISRQAVFTNPKAAPQETPTGDMREWMRINADRQARGLPPITLEEHLHKMANLKAPKTQLSVNTTQENEESKAVGKYFGEQYADIQKAGMAATGTIARMNQLQSLLDGVSTGKLTPVGNEVAAYAQSLGVNIDPKLGNKQAADAIVKELALQLRNPSGGAGMPGAMSDADREFLAKMTPSLGNTPEGNALMIDARRKLAQREQKVADLAREYRMRNGKLDDGFLNVLREYSEANPMFQQQAPARRRYNPATGRIE